jgi:transcription-repair coupling factor (superfamily II helicase)
MALRLQLYRRIGNIKSIDQIELMRSELVDRFGPLPTAVDGLLFQIRVKVMAQAIHATHVLLSRAEVRIKLPFLATVNRDLLSLTLGKDIDVSRTDVRMPAEDGSWQERLLEILEALEDRIKLVSAVSP